MGMEFETFGNAIVQFREDGNPVLTTDPWLVGTCYFGSWGMERPLTERQIRNVQDSPFVWISHGHPDHLHPESLALLSREKTRILLPDHYHREIFESLSSEGFDVTILPFKRWVPLTDRVRVMCLDNENQDGILVVQAGDALVINLNDSPLCGEGYFLRKLVERHGNDKTFLTALCSIDADMFNLVDEEGRSLAGPPDARKHGAIWDVAQIAARLGVKHFCCSSSQHVYLRPDSVWANPYRIGWSDLRRHWNRPEVRLIEPYVTVDLETCAVTPSVPAPHPVRAPSTENTAAEDWEARLTPEEWERVEAFIRKFEIIRDRVDFVEFTVGGESRRVLLDPGKAAADPATALRGIRFFVPRQPLLETVEYGYFDDLLIGNFMKTQLVNVRLYPDFSKQVGKLGGNAKVFTRAEQRKFMRHYFRRTPRAFVTARLEDAWRFTLLPAARATAETLGLKPVMKTFYRRYLRREPAPIAG